MQNNTTYYHTIVQTNHLVYFKHTIFINLLLYRQWIELSNWDTHIKGWALGRVKPRPSSMSTVLSTPSTFHPKHWRIVWTNSIADEAPGHTLLPLPNGKRWYCCPLTSNWLIIPLPFSLRNLSGMNSSGFSQWLGSLPIVLLFIKTMVFSGNSKPLMVQFSVEILNVNGPVGCSLSVAFTMAWM